MSRIMPARAMASARRENRWMMSCSRGMDGVDADAHAGIREAK